MSDWNILGRIILLKLLSDELRKYKNRLEGNNNKLGYLGVDISWRIKMENRKKMVKCAVCGHVMKEVENGGSKSPDISS